MAVVLSFMRVPDLNLERYDPMMAELQLDAIPRRARSSTSRRRQSGASTSARCGRPPRQPRASSSAGSATRSAADRVKEPLSYRIEPLQICSLPTSR